MFVLWGSQGPTTEPLGDTQILFYRVDGPSCYDVGLWDNVAH